MKNDNAPRLDLWVAKTLIDQYEAIVKYSTLSKGREAKFRLEAELTNLDFLKDELKELQSDIRARERFITDQLDQGL